jgi:hypothetical protein
VAIDLDPPRVLLCGSRHLQGGAWRAAVEAICDRLYARHGSELVLIEGGAPGADTFCGDWCDNHGFDDQHHRCHPVDWQRAKQELGKDWRRAGNDRNSVMRVAERPGLIVGVHPWFHYTSGGTSDMLLKGVLTGVPSWLVRTPDPNHGEWVQLRPYPQRRIDAAWASLAAAGWEPAQTSQPPPADA